jgi:hypothetical protein
MARNTPDVEMLGRRLGLGRQGVEKLLGLAEELQGITSSPPPGPTSSRRQLIPVEQSGDRFGSEASHSFYKCQ